MREPLVFPIDLGIWVPMSQMPTPDLRRYLSRATPCDPRSPDAEFRDLDFRRRYASLLLAERGQ